jgi:hypothetical protein
LYTLPLLPLLLSLLPLLLPFVQQQYTDGPKPGFKLGSHTAGDIIAEQVCRFLWAIISFAAS